ncbi:MAG TPA: hypothetical protein PK250_10060 [Syntrophobacter fumaroxidans]|nr:hypothetical protein [Syntrophobacter fumaroxidans]
MSFRSHGLRGRGGFRSPVALHWMKKGRWAQRIRPGEDAEAEWPRHLQKELPGCTPCGTLLSAGSIGDENRKVLGRLVPPMGFTSMDVGRRTPAPKAQRRKKCLEKTRRVFWRSPVEPPASEYRIDCAPGFFE